MNGPRDHPINQLNGRPLTDAQSLRLEHLSDTIDEVRKMMHIAEGSSEDDGWDFRSRRMQKAADHLEIALMMSRKAALEAP